MNKEQENRKHEINKRRLDAVSNSNNIHTSDGIKLTNITRNNPKMKTAFKFFDKKPFEKM